MKQLAKWIESNFLILAILFCTAEIIKPDAFTWLKPHRGFKKKDVHVLSKM